MKVKRKVTILAGSNLYNVTRSQLKRLCLTGMSNDGLTARDVEAIGATKLPSPPSADEDISTWDAATCQAKLATLLSDE